MALNLDIIGKKMDPAPYHYDADQVILYALGIGAGVENLDFVYEKNLKVYPTFAVIPFMPALLHFISAANLNMFKVLHGEQKVILNKPIPTSGRLSTTAVCTAIYDKGDNGAVVNIDFDTVDENGELIFKNQTVAIDRSAGNFGGARGPKSEKILPPEGQGPDFQVSYETSVNQGALYRLSGDKNPLHIDPDFAKKGGFDKPILHGLCSYGLAGRTIVNVACGGDPGRLKSFGVRFMNVAFPGDTLTTWGWRVNGGKYVIVTTNQDGQIILGNGLAEIGE